MWYSIHLLQILSQSQGKEQQPKMSFSQFIENMKQKNVNESSYCGLEGKQSQWEHQPLSNQQDDRSMKITAYFSEENSPPKHQNDNGVLGKQDAVLINDLFDEFENPSKRIKMLHESEWLQEEQTTLPDKRFHFARRGYGIKRRHKPGRVIASKRRYKSFRNMKLHHGSSQISDTSGHKQTNVQRPLSPYYPHALLSKPEELYSSCSKEEYKYITPVDSKDVEIPHALYEKRCIDSYVDVDKPCEFYSFDVHETDDVTANTLDDVSSFFRDFNFNESCMLEGENDYFSELSEYRRTTQEKSAQISLSLSVGVSGNCVPDMGKKVLDCNSSITTPNCSPVPERFPNQSDVEGLLNPYQYWYDLEDREIEDWWNMGITSSN